MGGRVCAAPSSPAQHPRPRCRHFLPTLPSYDCREEILAGDLTVMCRVPEERIRLSLRWRGSVSFLPSLLPSRGSRGCLARGGSQGQLQQQGLGCFEHQLLILTRIPECRRLWQTGIHRDDHTEAAGRLWEQGGNHSPRKFYLHLLLVIIFLFKVSVGKPHLKGLGLHQQFPLPSLFSQLVFPRIFP